MRYQVLRLPRVGVNVGIITDGVEVKQAEKIVRLKVLPYLNPQAVYISDSVGVNKHQTIIEDDAFIGSDTQLVAPVRVGRGATLGAGTTLTKDAPPDQLTISRAVQKSVLGWKRPVKIRK